MTITISNDDQRIAAEKLAIRLADTVRDRDAAIGEARDAQALAQQFKDERDTEKLRADQAEAAGVELVAVIKAGLQREAELEAERDDATEKAASRARIITGLEGLLGDYYGANRRLGEHVARLAGENRALRTRPRWQRARRD